MTPKEIEQLFDDTPYNPNVKRKLIDGLPIIAKYLRDGEEECICAEHDELYIGGATIKTSARALVRKIYRRSLI